jgi:nucleoside-diphosphate-sugar epimerase
MRSMRVLMTGATGFLGRALAKRLVDDGHALAAIVRGADASLDALGVETIEGDATSLDAVIAAAAGRDAIIHCAACTDPFARIDDYYDANVRATDNVLAACEVASVSRLVFTSCAGVVDGAAPMRAPTPYLATKALAERHVLAANGAELATVAIRPHLLWGPGEKRWTARFAAHAREGNLRLFGEAGAAIGTCYVDNAADAHVAALERIAPGAAIAGRAYAVGQDEPTTADAFVNGLLRAAGYPAETRRVSAPATSLLAATARLRRRVSGAEPLLNPDSLALFARKPADLSAARRDLDFAARVTTSEGFARVSAHLARERIRAR